MNKIKADALLTEAWATIAKLKAMESDNCLRDLKQESPAWGYEAFMHEAENLEIIAQQLHEISENIKEKQMVNFCWYCGKKLMRATVGKDAGKVVHTTRVDEIGNVLVMHKECADKWDCEQEQSNVYSNQETRYFCKVCKGDMARTPSGWVCANGHGGTETNA